MAHASHQATMHRRAMTAAVVLLALLAIVPARWVGWVGQFGALARYAVGPVSGLVTWAGARIAPTAADDPRLQELTAQRDQFQAMYLQQRELVTLLQRQLDEFRASDAELGLRLLSARVIGATSNPGAGILTIKAGRRHDVEPRTVATVGGAQVVGRVEDVAAFSSSLVLLTAKGSGAVDGVIVLDGEDRIDCRYLFPQDDGTLRGYVEYKAPAAGKQPAQAQLGQVVRLRDDAWGPSAQMLVLGVVDRIDNPADSPLRQIITVRPTVRLDRVTEVTLRLVAQPAGEPGGAP